MMLWILRRRNAIGLPKYYHPNGEVSQKKNAAVFSTRAYAEQICEKLSALGINYEVVMK